MFNIITFVIMISIVLCSVFMDRIMFGNRSFIWFMRGKWLKDLVGEGRAQMGFGYDWFVDYVLRGLLSFLWDEWHFWKTLSFIIIGWVVFGSFWYYVGMSILFELLYRLDKWRK